MIAQNLCLFFNPDRSLVRQCGFFKLESGVASVYICRETSAPRNACSFAQLDSYRLVSLTTQCVNRCQHRARDRVSHCWNCIVSNLLSFFGPWVPSYLSLCILSQLSGNSETSMIKKEVLVTLSIMQPCSSPLGSTLS